MTVILSWYFICNKETIHPPRDSSDFFLKLDVLTWTIECTPTVCIAWLSSSDAIATKLNPRKSWCALALGGIPGESEKYIIYLQADSLTCRYEIKYWNFGSTLNLWRQQFLSNFEWKKSKIQIQSFEYVNSLIHISLPFGVFAVNSGSK